MSKKKKTKKINNGSNNDVEVWTEEQYEEYLKGLYGMEFIVGFTENGVPYGSFIEDPETYVDEQSNKTDDAEDDYELPF
jgi:hypothetical protein